MKPSPRSGSRSFTWEIRESSSTPDTLARGAAAAPAHCTHQTEQLGMAGVHKKKKGKQKSGLLEFKHKKSKTEVKRQEISSVVSATQGLRQTWPHNCFCLSPSQKGHSGESLPPITYGFKNKHMNYRDQARDLNKPQQEETQASGSQMQFAQR